MNTRTPNGRMLCRSVYMAVATTALSLACHRTPAVVMTGSPPSSAAPQPQQQLSAPSGQPASVSPAPLSRPGAGMEEHVTIDTHGAEIDVRQALSFIASHSGISLVYSPEINKKVRLQLIDVPVSDALQAVLAVAGLTLESTTPKTRGTGSSSVVFYELPVNVDSLSADAIMKRFGVGRVIAELLVQGRTAKP